MKLFLLLLGLVLAGLALVLAPMAFGAADPAEALGMIQANPAGWGGTAAGIVLGIIAVFIAGCMFGRGRPDIEPPATCPACNKDMSGAWVCPECQQDATPSKYALDTAGLIGAIIGLLILGAVAGSPFFLGDAKLVAILFLAGLAAAAVGLLMNLGSLLAERRSVGLAITGLILNIAVIGFAVFLVI